MLLCVTGDFYAGFPSFKSIFKDSIMVSMQRVVFFGFDLLLADSILSWRLKIEKHITHLSFSIGIWVSWDIYPSYFGGEKNFLFVHAVRLYGVQCVCFLTALSTDLAVGIRIHDKHSLCGISHALQAVISNFVYILSGRLTKATSPQSFLYSFGRNNQ